MLEQVFEGVFNSSFTFSIPIWVVIIAIILARWLIYWDKSFSKLEVKGKPVLLKASHNSLDISWEEPLFSNPECYIIHYSEVDINSESWTPLTTSDKTCKYTIRNLSLNTKYKVKVSACSGGAVGPSGEESDVISTKPLAFKIKQNSTLKERGLKPGSISKYDVPRQCEYNKEMKIQTIKIGEANESLAADRKSILLMSTPHCGKTTHIEGIMNFIFGVNFEDDFRLFLSRDNAVETSDDVSDDDASDDNGTGVDEVDDHNHDDWIKVYQFDEFEGGRITFPLTIIDIPRLGSLTSGTKKLYKRIQFVMNSVCREINLVCLVAKGCDFEMSEEQLNYFSSILELFKDHLMSNFCAFYTFADAGKAHVAEIFQANEITPVESFHVNWSSLCQSNDSYSSTFWEMNSKQLGLFFDFLKQSSAKSIFKDLPTSQKREEIKCEISLLQPKVTEGLVKLGEVKFQIKTFTDYKADILSSGDISYTIEEIRQNKTDLLAGHHVTNCINCYFTCHEDCTIPDDKDKINCWAMTDGYCRICSMHCIWSDHKNTPYIYEYVAVKVTKSYQELKMNYEKEKGEQLTYEEYLNHLERDIEKLLERLHDNIKKISEGRNELQGIKHSPLACSVDETIEDMIASEMLKHETGFERRIQMYKELQQYSSSGMVRISRN